MKRHGSDDALRCSFCRKSQDVVGKLISSPSEYPRVYVCDECIAVCNAIIEDDKVEEGKSGAVGLQAEPDTTASALTDHPLAPGLLEAVAEWVREESLGKDGSVELQRVRAIARQMLGA